MEISSHLFFFRGDFFTFPTISKKVVWHKKPTFWTLLFARLSSITIIRARTNNILSVSYIIFFSSGCKYSCDFWILTRFKIRMFGLILKIISCRIDRKKISNEGKSHRRYETQHHMIESLFFWGLFRMPAMKTSSRFLIDSRLRFESKHETLKTHIKMITITITINNNLGLGKDPSQQQVFTPLENR